MAKMVYCWRCRMDMPMLDEEEWRQIAPLMTLDAKSQALELYQKLTGFKETNFNALWHHQICIYGPPCSHCGKPLRTAKAKWCAACGAGDESSLDSDAIPFTRAELIDVLNAHLALTAALTLLDVSLGHQFMVAKTKVRSVDQQPGFAEGLMLKFFSMGMHESTRMGHRIAEPRQLGMPTISDGLDDAFAIGQLACQRNVAFDTKLKNRLRGRKGPFTERALMEVVRLGLTAYEAYCNRIENSD